MITTYEEDQKNDRVLLGRKPKVGFETTCPGVSNVGSIYCVCPLVLIWVPNVIAFPAQKRAVSIALVNALGNSASIYGVFLWPARDAPRYVPGFVATTLFMALIAVLAQGMGYLVKKYPIDAPDPDEVVKREIEMQRRQRGIQVEETGKQAV